MKVYVLIEFFQTYNKVVAVFISSEAAIKFAKDFNIQSWHIDIHTLRY